MKRILVVGEGPYPNIKSGYSRYNSDMVKALASTGNEVYWMPTSPCFLTEYENAKILQPLDITIHKAVSFELWIKAIKPDLVILPGDWWVIMPLLVIAKSYSIESWVMLWVDGEPLPNGSSFLLDQADRIFSASKYGVKIIEQTGFNAEYAPPVIDIETFHPVISVPQYYGSVSRFMRRKGFESLLYAMTFLPKEKVFLHLDSKDPAAPFNLQLWVKELGLKGRILIPNATKIDDKILCNIYNNMHAHVLLSGGEGFGYSLVESQACGIPSIAIGYSSQNELVEHLGLDVKIAGFYKNEAGVKWAYPDISDAVTKMQWAKENRDYLKPKCVEFAKQFKTSIWDKMIK